MTSSPPAWEPLLKEPRPCDHLVQLYVDDAFMLRAVTQFLGAGLAAGEGAVLIATPEHSRVLVERLGSGADQRLVVLDAQDCLDRFMVAAMPDRGSFLELVSGVLDRIRGQDVTSIRLFGEMVDLLCERNLAATEALEELWNEAVGAHQVALLCAYRADVFAPRVHRGLLGLISPRHSHLVPLEDYQRLERAVDRAFGDVFGRQTEITRLRERLASRVPACPVAPAAHRALVAVQSLPRSIANAVLERARTHYLELSG
jgi:hypothetical protein